MRSPRFWTVTLLMVVTLGLLLHRGDVDKVPPTEPLAMIPTTIDGMTSRDYPLADDVLAILGKGDFLNRNYVVKDYGTPAAAPASAPGANYPIGLFIGYFATQRTGQTMHSPLHCLPGSGWVFESSHYSTMDDTQGKRFDIGEYVINNGEEKQYVIYWYQAHGRSVPNEYRARAYMLADAIRTNRTDGAIIRVITPIAPSEPIESARQRALRFTSHLTPYLPRFIPN